MSMYCCSYHGLAQAVAVATDVAAATTALVTVFFFSLASKHLQTRSAAAAIRPSAGYEHKLRIHKCGCEAKQRQKGERKLPVAPLLELWAN